MSDQPSRIRLQVEDRQYTMRADHLAGLLWASMPPAIRDQRSPQAQSMAFMRSAVKALLAQVLPKLLRDTWGEQAPALPRGRDSDLIGWTTQLMIGVACEILARQPLMVLVAHDTENHAGARTIRGIAPITADAPDEHPTALVTD